MSDYPSQYPPAGRVPHARVRFDAIPEAWALLQQQMGTWVLATLLMFAMIGAIYFVWLVSLGLVVGAMGGNKPGGPPTDAAVGIFVVSFIFLIIFVWVVRTVLLGGLFKMAVRQVRGELISAGDLFSTLDILPSLLGVTIVIGLAVCAGTILCVIPGLIVQGLLMLAEPLIVDQRIGVFESVSRSWDALKEDMLMATLFFIVLGVVAGLGAIACGVGILFTFPLLPLGIAIVYRDFFLGPQYMTSAYTPPPSPPPPPPPPTEEPAPPPPGPDFDME